VFINGAWVGIAKDPVELYNEMKSKKHKGIINIYTSIIFDYRAAEIRICSDGGRLSRPVLRVKDGKALITKDIIDRLSRKELSWNDLLTSCKLPEAVIEYIDPDEQNWSMIAMKDKDTKDTSTTIEYTHCEIHPSTIFGVLSSCTPFPDNNQAPRNTYQCLHVDETVLLSDGRRIRIADVKIGDEVVSFNPDTFKMSNTKVINQYVRTTDKKIYEIITKSGRKIKATEDHKFMTSDGWKRVDQINIATDRIGVYSEQNAVNNTSLDYSVIDNDIFKDKLKCMGVSDKLIYKYSVELEKHGLLPIRSENNKLYIIARIFGFVLSDGSLNVYTRKDGRVICQSQFDFGTVNDATKFENDVELCGFRRCAPAEGFRQLNNTIHHTFSVSHNGALPALLLALDATYGKKTETNRKPIPDWIMNGSDLVKREFISGFQGGDGCKIRFNKMYKRGYNYVCGETSQQINPMLKDSLRTFMEQCVSLISGFGIDVSGCKENNICETRIKLSFKISDTQSNLIRYFDTIGYRYAETKTMTSARIIEYLKMLDSLRLERQCAIQTIRQLYDEGKTNQQIATITGTQINRVSDAIRSYKNGRIISSSNLGENSIENWIATVDIKEACMLVPILSITEIENCIISDITVESDNHSFIAGNNFMSSNCAMAKQALGVYALNFNQRMDKTAYVLTNPSRPLVDTRLMNFIHLNQIPSGCQIHVAIMAHTGYNMEDSVLVNKGSIDRGLFSATIYHTEKDEDKNIIRDEIIRCKPDPSKTRGIKFGNYDKLNAQGFMPENTLIEDRDIIIAKIIPIKEARNDPTKLIKYEDQSHAYSTSEDTYVDKNYTGRNGDGYNFAKVRTRVHRKPRFGDKFSSRHGQKGTCGNIIPEEDMPFTKEGLKPDIIINPHAIPSRMTIGQLKETLLGKVLLELGMFGDGTSFGNLDVKTIAEELQKLGYESYGNEVMYNGLTGEQLETSIFIGPVFYQRLKHMTNDKVHSRATGPMVSLTHQPAEGRSRAGGLRIGEMERDVLISHGATRFCKERLFDVSDKYQVNVCKKCGMIAACNDGNNNTKFYTQSDFTVHSCKTCGNKTDFALVDMPYANKLLFQELQTINVVPRILTD
jgi:DNA-directed RNA polymerase beta subunit